MPTLRLRFLIPAFLAAAIALGLALPAAASAANYDLTVNITGTGGGEEVECTIEEPGEEPGEYLTEEETCEGTYPEKTKIAFETPVPDAGSEFVGFENGEHSAAGCKEDKKTCPAFKLEANSSVEVRFDVIMYTFKLTTVGEGPLECEVEAAPELFCPSESEYEYGTILTLHAEDGAESKFVGWSGCESNPTPAECVVTMEGPRSVTATFESTAERTLTVEETGPGTVIGLPGPIHCGSVCSARFRVGKKVTLTATPFSGSLFDGWVGGGCRGIGACTVTINADTTVAAEFEANGPPEEEEEEGTARAAASAPVRGGKAALKLSCSGGPCKGALQLTAKIKQGKKTKSLVIGKAPFSLAAGASKTIEVKLSSQAKKMLKSGKALKAMVTGSGIEPRAVKLK